MQVVTLRSGRLQLKCNDKRETQTVSEGTLKSAKFGYSIVSTDRLPIEWSCARLCDGNLSFSFDSGFHCCSQIKCECSDQ